jgi:PIN domain nuclease of toxin-antitoxin system
VTTGVSLVVELVYLVEKGTFSQANVEAFYEILDAADSGFEIVPIDGSVARAVSRIPRAAVADPFDRMIAATPLARAAPLVTYDRRLRHRRPGNHLVSCWHGAHATARVPVMSSSAESGDV